MKKLLFLLFGLILIMGSCRKEIPAVTITPAMARDSLYFFMNDVYYWYNLMPSVHRVDYDNPYDLLDAMMYKELDRWSFVADYEEFLAEMQGTFVGHGIRVGLDESEKARVAMIYNNSPLYSQGVRRGWIIKSVNNIDIAALMVEGDGVAYNDAFGDNIAGVLNTFVFQKPNGTEVTITSAKSSFTINSVLLYDTLHLSSGVTGHLVFESFIEPSENELRQAFAYFKANNVKDLILDLRYNSGGYLYVAQTLASYIGGNGLTGTTFSKLTYNNKLTALDTSFLFRSTSYPLELPRLFVITSRLTASASEAVINGLLPHIDILTIGDTTNGKPVGMNGRACGMKYIFFPITFKTVNSVNAGDYFKGLFPDKIANDDITHDFIDRNEACLKEAILFLETGSFSAKGSQDFKRSVISSEKPEWMNNTFVLRDK